MTTSAPFIPDEIPAHQRTKAYAKLAEECAEFIHAYLKCERHGYRAWHPETGVINQVALDSELEDVRQALAWVDKTR